MATLRRARSLRARRAGCPARVALPSTEESVDAAFAGSV
jgi:hypothetical protein